MLYLMYAGVLLVIGVFIWFFSRGTEWMEAAEEELEDE